MYYGLKCSATDQPADATAAGAGRTLRVHSPNVTDVVAAFFGKSVTPARTTRTVAIMGSVANQKERPLPCLSALTRVENITTSFVLSMDVLSTVVGAGNVQAVSRHGNLQSSVPGCAN